MKISLRPDCNPQNIPFQRSYQRYYSPFDPCPPKGMIRYSTPPQLYLGFQPAGSPQFFPSEALRAGTLWGVLYDPN